MRKPAEFGILRLPLHGFGGPLNSLCLGRGDREFVLSQKGQFIVVQMNHLVGVSHHGRNIRSREMTVLAHADDQRASPSGDNDLAGKVPVDDAYSKGAFNLRHGLSHGLIQVPVEVESDQLGQHLRVGFRPEDNP